MAKDLPLSYIELSKKNLIHNIKEFRKLVGKQTKISAVIKANAYGHGDTMIAEVLSPFVDYFQVDSVEELERVHKATSKEIFVFGYLDRQGIEKAIKLKAILSVFDFSHLLMINQIAKNLDKKAKVHIAIDSYLGREGILLNQTDNFIYEIKKMKNIIVDGIYSHFANIEDIHPDKSPFGQVQNFSHADKQIKNYHQCVDLFRKNNFNIKTHISATSGVLVYDKNKNLHDIVRIGIGLYGLWPSEHLQYLNRKKINLKPVLKWVSHIAQVKILPAYHPISYGLTYITRKKTKIAVIPQGYADGLSRSLSGCGEVIILGKKVKILGRIAMNMIVADVSKIKDVLAGDEVVILGKQGKQEITAEQIAEKTDTINYEVVTKISPLLPRILK
jgi:alanine racemase